ncbi:MAG: funZ protein [Anaerolineae bacterium]|nr:funZ protein [Anaerolineae bacterium]
MEMKIVPELKLGFKDAESYKQRENHELLNKIFVRTPMLDKLCESNTYFLVGEKGTGKTAYAVYLANNSYNNNYASLRYIRETEYQKFLVLKNSKHLTLSDYTNIWKVIIYLLLAQQVRERKNKLPLLGNLGKFNALNKAVDEYYQHAFSPEILYAIQFAEEAKLAAEIIAKYTGLETKLGGEEKTSINFSETRFQTNLLYIQKHFEEALSSLKLAQNHILFIDGIDIRPSSIPYEDYLDCVKGLANAVWSINSDFFANIKDSKGRLRVVLLIRPDIFNSLGLQNQNSKIRDNSVVLNWLTTYTEYRGSDLFLMADKLLAFQQETELPTGMTWDYYFPYNASNVTSEQTHKSAFISFLRYSLYRPRDILTMLSIQKENFIEQGRNPKEVFSERDFFSPAFTRKYSDYVLGEVKDHLSFYHSNEDYELFLKFFQHLNGHSRFTYDEFLVAFSDYKNFIEKNIKEEPSFCKTPDIFLQFLYDTNIICSVMTSDTGPFFGWCYRDRTPSNIAPKVRTHARYDVHYGLMKALDLGKHFD